MGKYLGDQTKTLGLEEFLEVGQRSEPKSATHLLHIAKKCIGERASERDTDSERSMKGCVDAFNALYDAQLTEEQGWMFMVLLKASRAKGGHFKEDDYVDMAAYAALAGECHGKEQ